MKYLLYLSILLADLRFAYSSQGTNFTFKSFNNTKIKIRKFVENWELKVSMHEITISSEHFTEYSEKLQGNCKHSDIRIEDLRVFLVVSESTYTLSQCHD